MSESFGVLGTGDIVVRVLVVGPNIDNDNVGRWVCVEIPNFWVVFDYRASVNRLQVPSQATQNRFRS